MTKNKGVLWTIFSVIVLIIWKVLVTIIWIFLKVTAAIAGVIFKDGKTLWTILSIVFFSIWVLVLATDLGFEYDWVGGLILGLCGAVIGFIFGVYISEVSAKNFAIITSIILGYTLGRINWMTSRDPITILVFVAMGLFFGAMLGWFIKVILLSKFVVPDKLAVWFPAWAPNKADEIHITVNGEPLTQKIQQEYENARCIMTPMDAVVLAADLRAVAQTTGIQTPPDMGAIDLGLSGH